MIRSTLNMRMAEHIQQEYQKLERLKTKLGYLSPQAVLNSKKQYVADLEEKLERHMLERIREGRHRIQILAGRLEAGSPVKKLSQGFSYVTNQNGNPITQVSQVEQGEQIVVRTLDGKIYAEVLDKEETDLIF